MDFKIKEARERIGLSQKELAESLGIKPTTFNGYEKGTHDPKSDILKQIAIRCNTSVDYLLGLNESPEQLRTQETDLDFKKQQLIHNYDKLNDTAQNALVMYSDFMVSKPENLKSDTEDNKMNA